MTGKWWVIVFDNGKTHFVPEQLRERLIQNMKDRGCSVCPSPPSKPNWTMHVVDGGGVCAGGARWKGESVLKFELSDGFTVKFFSSDAEMFLDKLITLKERLELGEPYVKLHGDLHCLCLPISARDELIGQMKARHAEIVATASADNSAWNHVVQALRMSPYVAEISDRPVQGLKEA